MKNNELKTKLLKNIEKYGRGLIEECIRNSVDSSYDVLLSFDEDMNLKIDESTTNNTILYNFKNSEYNREFYEIIYKELNKDEDDFENWFNNECCLDENINTYEEIILEKIEEIFSEEK